MTIPALAAQVHEEDSARQALELAREILRFEPKNQLILDYVEALTALKDVQGEHRVANFFHPCTALLREAVPSFILALPLHLPPQTPRPRPLAAMKKDKTGATRTTTMMTTMARMRRRRTTTTSRALEKAKMSRQMETTRRRGEWRPREQSQPSTLTRRTARNQAEAR